MVTRTAASATTKATPTNGVAAYLAAAPKDKRTALLHLRKTIRAAAPQATESISYGVVGFKHHGKAVVYLGYAKDHCALYGSTGHFIDAKAAALKRYEIGKGTIRFPADHPVPDRLVTRMVRARIAEIEAAG